ncbi:MAG: hypothetical protein GY928_25910 [Colwellia sp.]|nr:hypothetical protein [Colwellia sp.]
MKKCKNCGNEIKSKAKKFCSKKCFAEAIKNKPEDHKDCMTCMFSRNTCALCMYKSVQEEWEDNRHVILNREMAISRGKGKVSRGGAIRVPVGAITKSGKRKQIEHLREIEKTLLSKVKEVKEDKKKTHPKGWNTKDGRRVKL